MPSVWEAGFAAGRPEPDHRFRAHRRAMRENLEFKARCGDFTELERKVMALGAQLEGSYREVDTYFQVPVGRLRLRRREGRPRWTLS